ncbi:MAG TPA: TIGR00725 family protein [Myxococcales bacterium]|nr:TIGR00725 family protein [Myxococcales bacterium]
MERYIAVVGGGTCSPDELAAADEVGALLARAGAVVVCGGLSGVMEAACRGSRREGGLTVGILPGSDRAAANPHVVVALATGLGELRNGLVVRAADALIAVGGEFGTLSEIGFALKLGKRVVGLSTWELPRRPDAILRARTAGEAVRLALEDVASGGGVGP